MPPRAIYSKIWWTVALLSLCLLAFFSGITFLNPSSVGNPDFVTNTNLWAAVWAINFLLVLVLSFILARDLVKVYFEYQTRRPGSRIKSKLTITFILFSLFPALIMSFLAFGLINRNLQLWFTAPSEQLLGSTEQIVTSYYEQARQEIATALRRAVRQLGAVPDDVLLQRLAEENEISGLAWFDAKGNTRAQVGNWIPLQQPVTDLLRQVASQETIHLRRRLFEFGQADTDLLVVALPIRGDNGELEGMVVGQSLRPDSVEFHAIQVQQARQKFDQLKASVNQVEANYFAILVLSTLTLIFGFVWLANYIAKRVTVPLEALAEGAGQLAVGNLDHRVDVKAVDELGILVDAFNRMAGEIKESRSQLEKANQELIAINQELDERRRYTETILHNIATGVISLDQSDTVRTINDAALHMLQLEGQENAVGRPLGEVVGPELEAELTRMKRLAMLSGLSRKDLSYQRGEQLRFIAATVTANPVSSRDELEYLIVLDDLTELIRAEKFAAWQEVARRLAHEIKNPLTPIQLSAERIRKRFSRLATDSNPELRDFGQVLEDGFRIISAESEMLKNLVHEFSRFARLPVFQPREAQLNDLLAQTLAHYDGALEGIRVESHFDPKVGLVRLDPEQMRRVFVNLVDNALDALADQPGEKVLQIRTRLNPSRGAATVEFADNGSGIAPGDYENLFLPYFSTKKKGTGLGLAIVRQILSEHGADIRAESNRPQGMRFVIDIPLR